MRIAPVLAVLFSAPVLLLGAVVAQAKSSFVLTESRAGPGEAVHFSISGTEDATYSLEVDGKDVAEGEIGGESGLSGQFTMPDLGEASRAVTVEAQISQSEETATRTVSLQYVATSEGSTGAAGPQSATAVAPTLRAQSTTGTQGSQRRKHTTPQLAPRKRRAGRTPRHAPDRHPREAPVNPRRFTGTGQAQDRRGLPVSGSNNASPIRLRAAVGGPQSTANAEDRTVEPRVAPLLTGLPTPAAIFSLASGVPGSDTGSGGAPFSAAVVLLLLGLTAMTVAGGGIAPRRSLPRVRRRPRPRRRRSVGHPAWTGRRPARVRAPLEGQELAHDLLREAAASFTPIPLALLDERAALATRAERKFILDASAFERLVGELVPHCVVLEIDGARVFDYDTIYFDTPTLTSYRQHVQGRRRRFKCRTRLYAADGPCFFEVKLKGGRGETIKRRLDYGPKEHGSLTESALAFLEHELDEAYGASPPSPLAPTLRTAYRRLTLVGRSHSERLTFDFELLFAAPGQEHTIQPGRILLEAKAGLGGSEATKRVLEALRRLGIRPVQTCSKYCLGVALTHPEVRDNPFRPLIRKHFAAARHPSVAASENGEVPQPVIELEEEHESIAPLLPSWQEGTA
jgi:VTC domain-containing protein